MAKLVIDENEFSRTHGLPMREWRDYDIRILKTIIRHDITIGMGGGHEERLMLLYRAGHRKLMNPRTIIRYRERSVRLFKDAMFRPLKDAFEIQIVN